MVVKVVRYLHSGRKVDTAHIVANTSQPGGLESAWRAGRRCQFR